MNDLQSIKDLIGDSVYEYFVGGTGFSVKEILLILVMASFVGAYIFFVYKNFTKVAFYSRDLNVTMGVMCIIVAAIMIAMQSNLLVSLGMVGALSIVRFRTAIKNPLDLLYLFWSISEGIIIGVELYVLGIILCILVTIIIWLLRIIPITKAPSILILKTDGDVDTDSLAKIIKKYASYCHLSSTTIRNGEREIIYEIRVSDSIVLTNELQKNNNVKAINYLEHDGEIRG